MAAGLVGLAGLAAGCVGDIGEGPDGELDDTITSGLSYGEDLDDKPELCNQLRHDGGVLGQYVASGYHVIHGQGNIVGSKGPDIIFGSPGADHVWALGGDDIVCAGGGDDFVDGGAGKDRLYGEAGDDILHGRGGGDWLHGGAGDDQLYGDLLDDQLFGDEGDDLLVGGHGTDYMAGGPGKDWLRGDTNGDVFAGGKGYDTASFMTARPTGRRARGGPSGVTVKLPKPGNAVGVAVGDGKDELKGIEAVVGSPFDDDLSGPSGTDFHSGYGADGCQAGSLPADCDGEGQIPALPLVFVDAWPEDTGVVVLGSTGDDHLSFAWQDHRVVVTAENNAALHAGAHCENTAPHVVRCTPGAPLRYLMAWGDDGDDTLAMHDGFPRDFTAHLDGGEGNDVLTGANGDDILFSGRDGQDVLAGGPGEDALISETYLDEANTPFGGGRDKLFGGPGNDQLVSDYPCGGHSFHGGDGFDIAGFARVGERPIKATIGGKAILKGVCGENAGTSVAGDLEVLEGSKGNDELTGNDGPNVIWGRQGDDIIRGMGGDDVLEGHEGNDTLYGGKGADVLRGGSGFDRLYARDKRADAVLSCGTGGGVVMNADASDPKGWQCQSQTTCQQGTKCWCKLSNHYQQQACNKYGTIAGTKAFCKKHPNNAKCQSKGNKKNNNKKGNGKNGNGKNGNGKKGNNGGGNCKKGTKCWCQQGDHYKKQACDKYGTIAGTKAFCKKHPNNAKCKNGGNNNGGGNGGGGNNNGGGGDPCPHASQCWCSQGDNYKYTACDGYTSIEGTRGFCQIHPHNHKCDDYGSIVGTRAFCHIHPKHGSCNDYTGIPGTFGFCKLHPKNDSCNSWDNIPGTKSFCNKYPNSKYCK